jgi:hypothetical protein
MRISPTRFQTHYLIVAWLESGLPVANVDLVVKQWAKKFQRASHLSFVIRAWLEAGGEKEMVQRHIAAWLNEHGTKLEAEFVYSAWLEAGGEKEMVQRHIAAWLNEHGTKPEADFVYKAWLDAGGEKEMVQRHIAAWLDEHGTKPEADFVYRAWLEAGGKFSVVKAGAIEWLRLNRDKEEAVFLTKFLARQSDIPINTVRDILMWCNRFPDHEDALWRLTQLAQHLLAEEAGKDVIAASEAVLEPLISGKVSLTPVRRGQTATLFSFLIDAPHLRSGDPRSHVDNLLLAWLKNPNSFGDDPKPHANIQRIGYFQRVVDLIVSGAIDMTVEREPLERFLRWVANWEPEQKSRLHSKLDFLKQNYPVPGLWDIVA